MKEKLLALLIFILTLFKDIIVFLFNLFIRINKFLLNSKYPKLAYTFIILGSFYVLNYSNINFTIYKNYHTYLFDKDLNNLRAQVLRQTNIVEKRNEELDQLIATSVRESIYNILISKKDLCLSKSILDYKEDIRNHSFVLPSESDIEILKAELSNGNCSIDHLEGDTYISVISQIFGIEKAQASDIYNSLKANRNDSKNNILNQIDEVKEEIKKEEVKSLEKIEKVKGPDSVVIQTAQPQKSTSKEIKAIFCTAWHGGVKNGVKDPGAVSNVPKFNREVTERTLIEKIMPSVCDEVEQKVKDKWIVVYRVGLDDNLTLAGQIAKINEISKQHGYDEKNSIGVSLHYNMWTTPTRSWVEVYFSQQEQTSQGFDGERLAENMLYHIQKIHNHGNLYRINSSKNTRFKQLGILDNTKPLIALIELGFLSNEQDVDWALANIEQQKTAIVDSLVTFIN